MYKMILTLIFSLFFGLLSAPPSTSVVIFASEGICPYEPLIRAVIMVESNNGKYLFNPDENAVGYFQVREVRVKDYNKRMGTDYVLSDFYDYELSRRMFLHYCQGRSFESVAKSWNGSGPKVQDYWLKVQRHL